MLFDSKHLLIIFVLTLTGACIEITLPEDRHGSQRDIVETESEQGLSPRAALGGGPDAGPVDWFDEPDAAMEVDAETVDEPVEPVKAVVLLLSESEFLEEALTSEFGDEIRIETLTPDRPLGGWLHSSSYPTHNINGCTDLSINDPHEISWEITSAVIISNDAGSDVYGCGGRLDTTRLLREGDLWFATEGYPGTVPWDGTPDDIFGWIRSIGS